MTPAAVKAFLEDDAENLIAAMVPGGIEAQEKRGQMAQAALQTLPLKLKRDEFEAAGFVFGDPADDLFVNVTFPEGWTKKPSSHDMWTEILDEKGRVRGSIFYKAAFYDRSASARLSPRFHVGEDYLIKTSRTVSVRDACGVVQFSIEGLAVPDWNDRPASELAAQAIDAARLKCQCYLVENWPDYGNPNAYWND